MEKTFDYIIAGGGSAGCTLASRLCEYKDVNVLTDPLIRTKLSEQSGWPTIPQLFVKGKLIGGADITMELHQNGELMDILDVSEN